MHARKQYIEEIRKEYGKAGLKRRGELLDEAQRRRKQNRKYLIRVLNAAPAAKPERKRKRKRRAHYGAAVLPAVVRVWDIFDQPCGQRLAPALKTEVERLRGLGELKCSDEVAADLKKISARTIDRMLRREKQVRLLRRNRNPATQRLIYQKVPVKVAAEWDTSEVGNLQVDFVAHCGRSGGGEYVHTLSAVDIATGWWEGQAIAGRSQQATKEGMEQIRSREPFRIKEVHPDNDSAMVNELLLRWCREAGIRMSRSRPYKKNDNAWIEQKNWTHVRKVVGYARYDTMRELRLLNEIYAVLRLYRNYCLPSMKLASKVRDGGHIRRKYSPPMTPCQRLLESGQLTAKVKKQLRSVYESLNPAALRRRMDELRSALEQMHGAKPAAAEEPLRRGVPIELKKRRTAAA